MHISSPCGAVNAKDVVAFKLKAQCLDSEILILRANQHDHHMEAVLDDRL